MAITNFRPAVWAAQLLGILNKNLVYAGAPCVNRDYEGEISAYGDTVHIASISDVSIVDYSKDTDLTIEVLTDADRTLLIDQAKAFAFEVDDIDQRQARAGGALMTEAARRAAFGLRDQADRLVVSRMLQASTSPLGLVDGTTATNVYDNLVVPAGVKLDQNNAPTEGRFLVVDPATYGKLQLDARFIRQSESGTNALHNGVVGMAAGFTIYKSNNAPLANRTGLSASTHSNTTIDTAAAGTFNQGDVGLTITGTGIPAATTVTAVTADGTGLTLSQAATASAAINNIALAGGGQVAVAGVSMATTYAEQINKVEAFRPQKRFADALKGLHLYGCKVVRPELLVVSSVKVS